MKIIQLKYIILPVILLQFSCKKLIEIDPPKTSLVNEKIFNTNDQATAALGGIYAAMRTSGFASGAATSIGIYGGLSADELINYNASLAQFYENQLTPQYSALQSIYSAPYTNIFTTNLVIEGLSNSTGVTPAVKAQLQGEAYFLRAFNYFYLVNLFGDVPLQLSTDYRVNQILTREPVSKVYEQIVADLKLAESLLLDNYPTNSRIRANKTVAQAMLSRVYLYIKDWNNSEKYSSIVIGKSDTYSLVNFDAIFLANNQEAIWQLEPVPGTNANDAAPLIPGVLTSLPTSYTLSDNFALGVFEVNDKRKDNWVRSYNVGTSTFYYPFKYKIRTATTATEYSTVLRLAEQYLNRAEARINLGNVGAGVGDLNTIRRRTLANGTDVNTLSPLPLTLNKAEALTAMEKERRIEFFCEWAHRWLDLKRWEKASTVLGSLKPSWQATDVLYPIPQVEINYNPRITQNNGY